MFHESQLRNILMKINFQGEKTKKKNQKHDQKYFIPQGRS